MARYHGRAGAVYLSSTGSGTAVSVGSLSAWNIDMATDKVEVTAFQDPNKVYVQGLKDISGSLSGFWDSSTDALFEAADSADGIKMYLYPSVDAPTKYFYGTAWVDASIDTSVSAAITVSMDFVAKGPWGRK